MCNSFRALSLELKFNLQIMGKPFFHLYFSSNFSQLVLECSLFVVYEAKKSDAITVLRMNENSDPNVISTAEKKIDCFAAYLCTQIFYFIVHFVRTFAQLFSSFHFAGLKFVFYNAFRSESVTS